MTTCGLRSSVNTSKESEQSGRSQLVQDCRHVYTRMDHVKHVQATNHARYGDNTERSANQERYEQKSVIAEALRRRRAAYKERVPKAMLC